MKFSFWRSKSDRHPKHIRLGERGEDIATAYLANDCGYEIVALNVSLPIGRNLRGAQVRGEIDIVGYDRKTLCFVEVKTRTSQEIAKPEAAVDLRKQRALARSAAFYRRWLRLNHQPYRFDVVTVVIDAAVECQVELRRGYFSDPRVRYSIRRAFWDE